MEVFSLVKILPFQLMFVIGLVASNAINGGHLQEKMRKGDDYSHSTKNRSHEAYIQDTAPIRSMEIEPAYNPTILLNPDDDCYTKFFVNEEPPKGLRVGTNNLQNIRYICQQVNDEDNYGTMFDESHGIAVFSAYLLTDKDVEFSNPEKWRATPGINPQGSDAIYPGPDKEFDKGHLVPKATYSSTKERTLSTYVYTNAVPQYFSFNRGQWATFEMKIRAYAPKCTKKGGILYLLTGTSFLYLKRTSPWVINMAHVAKLGPVDHRFKTYPAISIPNSMWTAGCCVLQNDQVHQVQSFAVIGNNLPNKEDMLTRQITVKRLESILSVDVVNHQIGGTVKLFPGKEACSNELNDIPNLELQV